MIGSKTIRQHPLGTAPIRGRDRIIVVTGITDTESLQVSHSGGD